MNINQKTLGSYLGDLFDINAININVADMLLTAFNYVDILNSEEIKQFIKEGLSENEAIVELLYDFYQLDRNNKDNVCIMNEYFLGRIKRLEPSNYLNNPYVKAINKEAKLGKYALKHIKYEPYQLFAYDEISVDSRNYKEYSAIGYFDKPFSYLALINGNNVWMSLNPNEIETMKPFIKKGAGRVLVLGLGMGYVPFMLSLKEEVEDITIVETDEQIISLFEKHLLPLFPNKRKIHIIKNDAIEYTKDKSNCDKYDYIFADLWHNPEDGLMPFVELKRNASLINKQIDCWLETSLIALLRRCMFTLLEESLMGNSEEDYNYAKIYTDEIINLFYKKTKNITLNTIDDVKKLLSDNYLLSLIVD